MQANEFLDSREEFNRTWLFEEPEGTGHSGDLSTVLFSHIDEAINNKLGTVTHIDENYKKLEGNSVIYYWYENDGEKLIGAELDKKPQGLIVNMIGKKYKGRPPYASDLYNAVLNDRKNSGQMNNLLLSDSKLSDEGFNIWKKLLSLGHTIIVYNIETPNETFEKIETITDLEKYFKLHDKTYGKYRYALSESGMNSWETIGFFRIRQVRARNGLL